MQAAKRQERMKMPVSEVVKSVSKKDIDPWVRALVFELCCNDTEGEDVEVCCYHACVCPNILMTFPGSICEVQPPVICAVTRFTAPSPTRLLRSNTVSETFVSTINMTMTKK